MSVPEFTSRLRSLLDGNKVVLMGIGNPYRGDDSVGSLLAEKIGSHHFFVSIVCEEMPENYTDLVRAENPDVILFADAINFGGKPGQIVFLDPEDLTDDRFSSHRPSLRLIMDYLKIETGAETILLGIQPKMINYTTQLSPAVEETLKKLVKIVVELSQTINEDWTR